MYTLSNLNVAQCPAMSEKVSIDAILNSSMNMTYPSLVIIIIQFYDIVNNVFIGYV